VSRFGILISELNDGWSIECLSPHGRSKGVVGNEPSIVASQVMAFANEHSLDIEKIMIAVGSESVLFAAIPLEVATDIRNNQALRFALESELPIDAESIVADAIAKNGKRRSGRLAAVCLEVARLKPIVDALEKLRGRVQFIVPSAILALEQAVAEKLLPTPSISIWSLDEVAGSKRVEVLVLGSDKLLCDWRISSLDKSVLNQHLLQMDSNGVQVLLCGNNEDLQEMSEVVPTARSIAIDRPMLLRTRANSILSRRDNPCVDLRRDELAGQDPMRRDRPALMRLALAFGILVVTLCGALLWNAYLYRETAGLYKMKQQQVFRSAFPTQRTPAAILARLKSEHTKAKGTRKTDTKTESPQSALLTLHGILDSLTDDFPFEIDNIRIENGRFTLEIELRSQQDAGRIVALLSHRGFDVEPPSTTLINGERIQAKINARVVASLQTNVWDGGSIP
jgi:hypothetical protein